MVRRSQLPKAIGSKALYPIFFKFPIPPRPSLGTFFGDVVVIYLDDRTPIIPVGQSSGLLAPTW
jgi:hypothetical protein